MTHVPQTSLGGLRPYPVQPFRDLKLCRITAVDDLLTKGRVEVVTQDGGAPVPAMVLEIYAPPTLLPGTPGTPVTLAPPVLIYKVNDPVIVGFIDGLKDNPVVLGRLYKP